MSSLWVVGDVHGAHDKLRVLLMEAGLIDRMGQWTGGSDRLVFLGDYVDRGADGLGVIRLIRELEYLAPKHGGRVAALLGNHEVMFLAAQRFRRLDPEDELGFYRFWHGNGGKLYDQERLTADDIDWMVRRPAMGRAGPWLLTHADSTFYLKLGRSIEAVNKRVRELLCSDLPNDWDWFAHIFLTRLNYAARNGPAIAANMLEVYGGERIVHGHSPTPLLLVENDQMIYADPAGPVEYADKLCVDVDSGMAYFPDMGFMVRLEGNEVAQTILLPDGMFGPPRTLHDSLPKDVKSRHDVS